MPYSKDPDDYPAEYLATFIAAAKDKIVLNFPTAKEAIHERHRLNAYRRALRDSPHQLPASALQVEIKLNGTTLALQPRGLLFRSVLANSGVILPDPVEEELSARLPEADSLPEGELTQEEALKLFRSQGEDDNQS